MDFPSSSTVCIKMKTTNQVCKNRKKKKKHYKMVLHSMENGTSKQISDTVEAIKSGPTAAFTTDTGSLTRQMVEEDSFMRTETFMMGTGRMTKLMDLDSILSRMERSMKGIGLTISSMEKERRSGPMVRSTKVNTSTERKMDSEISVGLTSQAITETL